MASINTITTCANCDKEGGDSLKACTACKIVKYCNRECQIAHRPLHKKACKKRVAELHDEALFKEHTPPEDCPVCFLPLPVDGRQIMFQPCCGKMICFGCMYVMGVEARQRGKISLCAFCRVPAATSEEETVRRMKKLIEAGNARAFYNHGAHYADGTMGMPQDFSKACELYLKAGELGCCEAYHNLGVSYENGEGVEVDKKKVKQYYELAAMNGSLYARHNLGCFELEAGNHHRAIKHFILSAKAGFKDSLDNVKIGYTSGVITKDEYANTMRAYQQRVDEMKSDDRDKARANTIDGVLRV